MGCGVGHAEVPYVEPNCTSLWAAGCKGRSDVAEWFGRGVVASRIELYDASCRLGIFINGLFLVIVTLSCRRTPFKGFEINGLQATQAY